MRPEIPHGAEPIRVLRIIARLNIGGPAIQAITLTKELTPLGFRTTLVRGTEEQDEGSMDALARQLGVQPVTVRSLRRKPGWHDIRAFAELVWIIARLRPHVIHTHAAKAGTVGRLAALIAAPRSIVVHTFHGHSLRGYFSSRTQRLYLTIERVLARRTRRLIAVSEEVRDELVAMGVAPAHQFDVVHLGFDLASFYADPQTRARRRRSIQHELGISRDETLVTLVARLVPIKRVDRFLRVAAQVAADCPAHFLVVGDGELRSQLQRSPLALELSDRITWTGFRSDMPLIYGASDVVVLTSDNEGTPVSLIEAQAAGVPVVTTDVGGARTVVVDDVTGYVVPASDEHGLADAVIRLVSDDDLRWAMGGAGIRHVTDRFGLERLVSDIAELYARNLGCASQRPGAGA